MNRLSLADIDNLPAWQRMMLRNDGRMCKSQRCTAHIRKESVKNVEGEE
jgi:hypothetical protein